MQGIRIEMLKWQSFLRSGFCLIEPIDLSVVLGGDQ